MADQRLPNLIIAGVAKAGTTSLFNYLAQHPEIFPSDVKETRYFDPLRFGEQLEPLETYAEYFRRRTTERYAVEATPSYFQGGSTTAEAIRRTLPDARVVVILRSPPERCWSYYRYERSRGRVPADMDFDGYLSRCEELHALGADGLREHRSYTGLIGGCYAKWLDSWSSRFGSRLKVVYFDDLTADAPAVVKAICTWLEIDAGVVDRFDFQVENQTKQVRSQAAQQLALAVNRRAERLFRRRPNIKRRLRGLYYLVNRDPAESTPSAAATQRLARFYKPHDDELARQLRSLGLPRPPWLHQRDRRLDLT
jgi:hypothetical protein